MIWRRVYSLLTVPLLLLWMPYLLYQALVRGKYRSHLGQRLGLLSREEREELRRGRWLWVHAVSVGEIEAAGPLLSGLKEGFPDHRILLSTTTDTGWEHGRKQPVDRVVRFPLDLPGCGRRVLSAVRPEAVVIMETEIWPNFLRACRRLGAPVIIANGRLSDRSYRRYRLIRRPLRVFLRDVDLLLMQSREDARRIRRLGAEPDRVRVAGNLKFDRVIQATRSTSVEEVRRSYGLPEGTPLVVAGSTHPPEGIWMVEMLPDLLEAFPELVLLVAPRHLDRPDEIQRRAEELGLRVVRRSSLPLEEPPAEGKRPFGPQVILMDRMGELSQAYAPARCAFVGRSLSPTRGGQNVLEPAAWGVPALFGPHTGNFRAAVALLLQAGCAVEVKDPRDLAIQIRRLLEEPDRAGDMGRRAREVVRRNRGATGRVLEAIRSLVAAAVPPR